MKKEKKIVRNDSERKKEPQKGHNAQLEERIKKILIGTKTPLPLDSSVSGQHPDEFNSSDLFPSFRKTSRIDIPAHSPVSLLPESCSNGYQNQRRNRAMESPSLSQPVSRKTKFADTLKNLEIYEDLSEQLDLYTTLLENADKHQYSVRPSTYKKVRNEYAGKQSSLKKDREEQSALLQKELQGFLQQQSRLEEGCERQEDRIEEITFRVTAGEFTEEEIQSERNELEQELLHHTTNLEQISQILSRFLQIGLFQETEGPDKRDDLKGGNPNNE